MEACADMRSLSETDEKNMMVRTRAHLWTLNGKVPEACTDVLRWARWLEKTFDDDGRRVAQTRIGDVWISTVFLGLDHNWRSGPPILFETMAFVEGRAATMAFARYSTWDEAMAGHALAVKTCQDVIGEGKKAAEDFIARLTQTRGEIGKGKL